MRIADVRHKGLRRLIGHDDRAPFSYLAANKLRNMLAFLQDMEGEDELRAVPVWKVHRLTGDPKDVWVLFAARNWRLTFRIGRNAIAIIDLDYEDCH